MASNLELQEAEDAIDRHRARIAELAAENERLTRLNKGLHDEVQFMRKAAKENRERHQEPVAWMIDRETCPEYHGHIPSYIPKSERTPEYGVYPLYTRPAEQAVTEEWREIKQHVQPRIADGYTAVAISKPGYWFVKGPGPAALKAAMEAGG